jgi:hypothetical protein
MSVLLGYCPHGTLAAALMEDSADAEQVEEFLNSYQLQIAETATFSGTCELCRARYDANVKLLREHHAKKDAAGR